MPINGVGVITDHSFSFIDHTVPLCHLLEIPLFTTDPGIKAATEIYYPELPILVETPHDHTLDEALKGFDVLVHTNLFRTPYGCFNFADYTCKREARSICSLHGISDKGRHSFWLERLADEDILLLYGQHFVDFAKEKGVWERISNCILMGNLRYAFYKEHQPFFDGVISAHLFPKDGKRTLLYAPTWSAESRVDERRHDYSTFLDVYHTLFETLPEEFNLYFKPHPLLMWHYPEVIEELKKEYEENPQIHFLLDMPLIYPLLAHCDFYIGDYSSITYDFLAFNRPLFFLADFGREVDVFRCGVTIFPDQIENLYKIISSTDPKQHETERLATYAYAYGEEKPLGWIRERIEEALG